MAPQHPPTPGGPTFVGYAEHVSGGVIELLKEADNYGERTGAVDISAMPELARLADEVQRTQRPLRLRHGGRGVAVLMPLTSALDAGYQSIPALAPSRSWHEVTGLAADEHARHAAREGLPER